MSGQIIEFEAKVLNVQDRGRAVVIRCEGWDKPVWIGKGKGFPMPELYQKIHVRGMEADRYIFAREVWLIPENPAEDWPAVDKAELQKIRQTLKLDHEAWYVIVGSRYHVNPRTMEEYRRKIGAVEAEAEKWVGGMLDFVASEVRRGR